MRTDRRCRRACPPSAVWGHSAFLIGSLDMHLPRTLSAHLDFVRKTPLRQLQGTNRSTFEVSIAIVAAVTAFTDIVQMGKQTLLNTTMLRPAIAVEGKFS